MSDVATTRSRADAARALTLEDFPVHRPVTTRWSDNDMYGHLNNAVYYELFDSAINGWQAEHLTTDPMTDPTQGVVAESGCAFFAEVGFPSTLVVGLRVARIGTSSVTYELGLFVDPGDPADPAHLADPAHPADPADPAADQGGIKALGHWVHVEIDATTRRPTPIPDPLRTLLQSALVEPS